MRTKLPEELQAGDRLVSNGPPLQVAAFASDPPSMPLVLLFTDGTTVTITELDVPVEVYP